MRRRPDRTLPFAPRISPNSLRLFGRPLLACLPKSSRTFTPATLPIDTTTLASQIQVIALLQPESIRLLESIAGSIIAKIPAVIAANGTTP